MYKLVNNIFNGQPNSVIKNGDGYILSIPFDPSNTDYQAYLAWLAEGHTPEPAETQE